MIWGQGWGDGVGRRNLVNEVIFLSTLENLEDNFR